VSYGPLLNTAAIVLAAYGNVPPERAARLIGMLLRVPVSAGFVDKANARLAGRLDDAGFDAAMRAALAEEPVLAADESPVNVLTPDTDPDTGEPVPGAAQVMVIRTPAERLVWLTALASRRAAGITSLLAFFTGFLIVDGYTAYQQLSGQLAGIQQCCQHVIRRCRAVSRLGPGGLQSWATDDHGLARGAPGRGRHPGARRASPGCGPAQGPAGTLRRRRFLRDHPQPAAGLGWRREPPRLRARLLAARARGPGLAVHGRA
jgi:hypothetical protein